MVKAHSLRRWVLGSLAGIAILGPVDLYGFGHLVFHVPVTRLWEPFWLLSIPILMLAPSMYWASNSQPGLRLKRTMGTAGLFMWLVIVLAIYYSVKFGIIEAEAERPMYIISTLGAGLGTLLAYQVRKIADGQKPTDLKLPESPGRA